MGEIIHCSQKYNVMTNISFSQELVRTYGSARKANINLEYIKNLTRQQGENGHLFAQLLTYI